jgi:hypothetical protein
MSHDHSFARLIVVLTLLRSAQWRVAGPQSRESGSGEARKPMSHQDWPTGHYKVVEGWPKPLPTLVTHTTDGPGDPGGVYAKPRPNMGCHARRAAAAEGRRSVDTLRG